MGLYELRFPELGEGLHEGRIAKWLVRPGDVVKEDDALAEVENDKATVELPTPVDGKIAELRLPEGATAIVGDIIALLEVEGKAGADAPGADVRGAAVEQAGLEGVTDQVKASSVGSAFPGETPASGVPRGPADAPAAGGDAAKEGPGGSGDVLATPGVRRFAREKGVVLSQVAGTGSHGKVTREDVERHLAQGPRSAAPVVAPDAAGAPRPAGAAAPAGAPDGQRAGQAPQAVQGAAPGEEERVALTSIRKLISAAMARSKYTAPHVTLMDEADVTELVALRAELKPSAAGRGVKLTYLPFLVKAVVAAAKAHPQLNASLDEEREELVLKRYYHIGIATDTDRGLLVPVVRNADRKNMWTIASEIDDLATRGRAGKLGPGEMKGSTISITNIGSAGGMFFTPIINYPEVAILGVGRITERPVMRDGQAVGAQMLALSLSIDHRVIDGVLGQQFLNTVKSLLGNPRLLLMEV